MLDRRSLPIVIFFIMQRESRIRRLLSSNVNFCLMAYSLGIYWGSKELDARPHLLFTPPLRVRCRIPWQSRYTQGANALCFTAASNCGRGVMCLTQSYRYKTIELWIRYSFQDPHQLFSLAVRVEYLSWSEERLQGALWPCEVRTRSFKYRRREPMISIVAWSSAALQQQCHHTSPPRSTLGARPIINLHIKRGR